MRTALLLTPLLLSACATVPGDPVVAEPSASCRGNALAQFVGQPATQELGARMLRESGARVLRWVPDGMMVTMDYRGDRLTVRLDKANRVESVNCG